MRLLPSTFFYRLDCHQAAVVVGFFDLFFHVPIVVLVYLIQVFLSPENEMLYAELVKEFGEQGMEKNEALISSIKIVQLTDIITTLVMMYGVIYRKRWFMVPWFVWAFLDFVSLVLAAFAAGEIVVTFLESSILAITLLVILILLIIAIEGYLSVAVLCSFREIGVANADTPNRDTDISVQFQPIDHNRGGLV